MPPSGFPSATNEIDRLMAVNCGPYRIMAQGISTYGPIDTALNCSRLRSL